MRRLLLVFTAMAVMVAIAAATAIPAFAANIKTDGGPPEVSGNLNNPSIFSTAVYHNNPLCEPSVQVSNKNGQHGCGTGDGA